MFADYIKMGVKAALILVITAAIVVLLNTVQIPQINFSSITTYMNTAYTFLTHWCPAIVVIWPIALAMITLEIAIMGFQVGAMAWRWIFKVNE